MDSKTRINILNWEKERDRNLRIHCPHVAAKFQRWIDREMEKERKKNGNHENKIDNQ